jgi:hypothetical protein
MTARGRRTNVQKIARRGTANASAEIDSQGGTAVPLFHGVELRLGKLQQEGIDGDRGAP